MEAATAYTEHEGRSREGAWIEMWRTPATYPALAGRSREGAWIEMSLKGR